MTTCKNDNIPNDNLQIDNMHTKNNKLFVKEKLKRIYMHAFGMSNDRGRQDHADKVKICREF